MRIGFFSSRIPFEADLIENGLAGGSENALVNLTREWKKNNPDDEVIIYNNNSGKYHEYNGIKWKSIIDFQSEVRSFNLDVLISLREPEIFLLPYVDSKLKVLWSQDTINEASLIKLQENKYNIINIDLILANSKFSYNNLIQGFSDSNIKILLNGYNSNFINNVEKEDVAIFNTTPFRGLLYLLDIWPEIYNKCKQYNINPRLEIYGDMELYNQSNKYFNNLYSELSKLLNVTVFGSITQKKLYNKMNKSRLLLYPCNYCETSCMSMIEAMACGNWPISTNIGALNELIINDKCGNLINGNPDDYEYKNQFIKFAVNAFIERKVPEIKHLKTWNEQSVLLRNIILEKL